MIYQIWKVNKETGKAEFHSNFEVYPPANGDAAVARAESLAAADPTSEYKIQLVN